MSFDSDVENIADLDFDRVHTLTGPACVEGAEPGDMPKNIYVTAGQ